jgi:hypothetical protein
MSGQSTLEIHLRAQSALSNSTVYALRELTVEPVDDGLLISGSVCSFYHKQLAQETVRAVAPAVDVINSVRVD